MRYKKLSIQPIIGFLSILTFFTACEKLVDVPPPITSINGQNVYDKDGSAAAVLTGLYISLYQSNFTGGGSGLYTVSGRSGLSADELTLFSGASDGVLQAHYNNNFSSQLSIGPWIECYNFIHTVNSALEGIDKSSSLTPSVKKQLEGEAKFLRAFYYFYLVNFYGDVPLVTTSDWRKNATITRSPKSEVWQQIVTDLKDAQSLLSTKYLAANVKNETTDRVRPTSWAATALLARTYLYLDKWNDAEVQASSVINNANLFDTTALNDVFLSNSKEAIWQLMSVKPGLNTEDGPAFILQAAPDDQHPVYLSSTLLNAFGPNDQRKTKWTGSFTSGVDTYYYPFKYKINSMNAPMTEYTMILRLAEVYLIRAEARAQQNKITEAQNDLNIIRTRAGLTNTVANDKTSLLNAILHERQVELFTEWGHRWFDLIRTGNINSVMDTITPIKTGGSQWQPYQQLYPISYADVQLNPNLTQNQGY